MDELTRAPVSEAGNSTGLPENTEIELKLSADRKGLARVRRTPFWSGHGRAQTRVLDSVYFDTVDHKLRTRGITLRVRKVGRNYVQTLKVSRRGDHFSRGEFEQVVPDSKPDPMLVANPQVRSRVADIASADLKPVFTTHVRRSRKLYETENGSAVEIALDEGEVRGENRASPLSEIELELKKGEPQALFDMARSLSEIVPVRLQVHSKPELGYELCADHRKDWAGAGKLKLETGMTTEDALDAIVDFCAAHILRNETCARERLHIEGVHQVRVGLRRLRSGLNLFRRVLPPEQFRWVNEEAKVFAKALEPARELDVFRDEILPPVAARLAGHGDFVVLDQAAARLQDEAYEMVRDALTSQRFTRFMIELLRWRKTRAWRDQPVSAEAARLFAPIGELARPLLAKRHKSVLKKGRGFEGLPLAERHEVRLAVKKLRYATDFFASLHPGKATRGYLKRLSRLQEDLGHLNDVATLGEVLDRVAGPGIPPQGQRAAGCLLGWFEREIADGDARLVADWKAFEKASPFWK